MGLFLLRPVILDANGKILSRVLQSPYGAFSFATALEADGDLHPWIVLQSPYGAFSFAT